MLYPKIKQIDDRINVTTYISIPKWYKYVPILNSRYYLGINGRDVFRRSWKLALKIWWRYIFAELIMKYRWYSDKKGDLSIRDSRFNRLLK